MELNILSFHGLYSQGNNLEILINALEFEAEENGIDVVTSQHDYPVLKIWHGFYIPAKNLTQIETSWAHSDFVNPKNFELIRDNLFGK